MPTKSRAIGETVVLNKKTYTIKGFHKRSYLVEDAVGKKYKIGPEKMERMLAGIPRAVHRRSSSAHAFTLPEGEKAIVARLQQIECELSPENLHCDGEISLTAARRKAGLLNAEKRQLEQKLGRPLTQQELYGPHWRG